MKRQRIHSPHESVVTTGANSNDGEYLDSTLMGTIRKVSVSREARSVEKREEFSAGHLDSVVAAGADSERERIRLSNGQIDAAVSPPRLSHAKRKRDYSVSAAAGDSGELAANEGCGSPRNRSSRSGSGHINSHCASGSYYSCNHSTSRSSSVSSASSGDDNSHHFHGSRGALIDGRCEIHDLCDDLYDLFLCALYSITQLPLILDC